MLLSFSYLQNNKTLKLFLLCFLSKGSFSYLQNNKTLKLCLRRKLLKHSFSYLQNNKTLKPQTSNLKPQIIFGVKITY